MNKVYSLFLQGVSRNYFNTEKFYVLISLQGKTLCHWTTADKDALLQLALTALDG